MSRLVEANFFPHTESMAEKPCILIIDNGSRAPLSCPGEDQEILRGPAQSASQELRPPEACRRREPKVTAGQQNGIARRTLGDF